MAEMSTKLKGATGRSAGKSCFHRAPSGLSWGAVTTGLSGTAPLGSTSSSFAADTVAGQSAQAPQAGWPSRRSAALPGSRRGEMTTDTHQRPSRRPLGSTVHRRVCLAMVSLPQAKASQ